MLKLVTGRRLLPPLMGLLAILLILGVAIIPRAVRAVNPDPITAAWDKARAAGSYQFDSDITQITIPVPKVNNVGRSSRTEQLHLRGETDLHQKRLEMQLWSDGGSVVQGEGGIAIKVEDGKSYVRRGAGEWQESEGVVDGLAPQGDFLAYLQAVRDIQANPPEERGGIRFTRYTFTLDGPSFAAYVRDRLEDALRARGELPPGVRLDTSRHYREMTGTGELWVGEDGLPLRQILNLDFPAQRDEYVSAQIVVDFSRFGDLSLAAGHSSAGTSHWLTETVRVAGQAAAPLSALLAMTILVAIMVYYRRTRVLQTALATAVIASLVIGPLLNTLQVESFYATQAAKAATQEEQQASADAGRGLNKALGAVAFNPHVNPLETGDQRVETQLQSPVSSLQSLNLQSANLQLTDDGVDSDGDGLSDFVEERVGTDPDNPDSDEDGLSDALEVKGFQFAGKTWHLNPLEMDSNRDGIADGLEWDNNGNGQPDDTDGDGIPDVFDPDNDGDGVPDRLDLSPYSKGNATFSEASPLQLTLSNLTAGKPTLVDFQVRPTAAKHLWFAFNVLDWPRNDDQGQVQDVDGGAFADLASAQGRTAAANEAYGDMKLIPMLEIRISGATTNLPPQSDLTPYNIVVNKLNEDGSEKVVYVPLSLVTDEQSGQRVAFSGRMRYLPTGPWPTPHTVRLAWVVQMLADLPCNPDDPQEVAEGCAADGYIHNVPQVVQSYYDDYTLTGLNVSEQHGAKTALIYEDPAVDPNRKDDAALVTLTSGLDDSFLSARDQDNNNLRDVDIDEIARRFHHPTNDAVSVTQRWGMEDDLDILRVERHDYATFDQAVSFTAMTETVKLLNTEFNAAWTADHSIKPTVLFAYEQQARALSLDATRGPGGYVTLSGNAVTLNMQPAGQSRAGLNTMVGIQWTHYCRTDAWAVCDADVYWDELENRYATSSSLPGDGGDPDLAAGRMFVNHLYDLSLVQGIHRSVQVDNQLVSSRYTLLTDSEREQKVRIAATGGVALFTVIADIALMGAWEAKNPTIKLLGQTYKSVQQGAVSKGLNKISAILKNFKANKVQGTGIALTGALVLGGLATAVYFGFGEGNTEAKVALKAFIVSVQVAFSIVEPLTAASTWATQLKSTNNATSIWHAKTELVNTSRVATAAGAVIAISVVWGFFIYSMVSNKISVGSPEFNKALAETIAATIYIIILTMLSLTVVGLILVGIVTVIDAILTSLCELGMDDLRNVPGMGGACFTLGAAAVKAIAYAIYNYELMIDTARPDMVAPGAPKTVLADPKKGFVAGNDLAITMPITTHVVHKNPNPSAGIMINFYLYLFSKENLRSTTFQYSLTQPNKQDLSPGRNQMNSAWQNVAEDHKYVRTPMYGGYAYTTPPPVSGFNLQPGLNRAAPFYLNMGYALPAYECWVIPVVFVPAPVCSVRTFSGKSSSKIDTLHYDIFPATFVQFVAMAEKPGGGVGLGWDATFPALRDADGDGLLAGVHGGLDPNDNPDSHGWDTDNDGLTDAFEVNRRAAGLPFSPVACDTDGDGLTDAQEAHFGTNPAIADSDNDGLLDSEEVWREVYNMSTCQPTGNWAGGWNVTINAATPFTIRVTSNPLLSDSDGDGISDLAEKQLAQHADLTKRLDKENRPYHPGVFNVSPIIVYTDVDDADRFVALDQSVIYTTTVVGEVPLAPSMLDISAPGELGGARLPALLTFDAANSAVNQTHFTVQNGNNGQPLQLTSDVRARLAPSGPSIRTWDPIALQSLGSTTHPTRFMAAAPYLASRQDSYALATLTSNSTAIGGQGDLRRNLLPGGQANTLSTSSTSGPLMGNTAPDVACTHSGACMFVWHQRGYTTTSNDYVMRGMIYPDAPQICCLPVNSFVHAFRPAIATDGVNYMVAYVLAEAIAGTAPAKIVMTRFDSLGIPQSSGSWTLPTTQSSSSDFAIDLVYANGYYVVAVKRNNDDDPIANRRIQIGIFNEAGAFTGSANLYATQEADETEAGAPVLAQNTITGWTLLLYRGRNGEVRRNLAYHGYLPGIGDPGEDVPLYDPAGNPIMGSKLSATHDPRTNEWLITVDGRVMVFDQWLNPVLPAQDVAPGSQVALACPAPVSLPVRDLRFEEFPGANNFGGAFCSGNQCPAAGLPGATDSQGNAVGTPGSDYSIQFDGVDDELSMGNPLGNEFSLAFWYKATGGAGSTPFSIESNQPAGFGLFIYNTLGVTEFFVGNTTAGRIAAPQGLADGQWHFVVATRTSSGAIALYLDGNPTPVASAATSPTPAMGSSIQIRGGNRSVGLDNLQLYKVALPGEMVQALYNRTAQSYCVGVEGYRWTRINTTSPDTRGGKITATGSLVLTVDRDLPTATIVGLTNNQYIPGNTIRTIGGNAGDPTSGVARVEVSVNNGPWEAASGAESWAYNVQLNEGGYSLRVRAIDAVGNVGNPSPAISVVADATPPVVTLGGLPAAPRLPVRTAGGQWQTTLTGTAIDSSSGIPTNGVEVLLQGQGDALGNGWQSATRSGNNWSIDYLFAPTLPDPTGAYTVSVRAVDTVGNHTADNAATGILRLDAAGPVATLSETDATRQVISETLTITGLITETGPGGHPAGLDKLEIAFVSVEAIAALPTDATADEVDALLNRTWLPATLAQRGAGIAQSSWSFPIPAGLENEYQMDLRATDMLGNVLRSDNAWRGVIDTLAPRVVVTGSRGATSWFDPNSGQQMYELTFTCAAVDRYLNETTFSCPAGGAPMRSFDNNPDIQALFPDRTIVNGLTVSAAYWWPDPTVSITVAACDAYGNCASSSQPLPPAGGSQVALSSEQLSVTSETVGSAAFSSLQSLVSTSVAPGAPFAVVVAPTAGSIVAADGDLAVSIAAEAGAGLKEVTIRLDNNVVQTLSFTQNENATRILRTVNLSGVGEGQHTLVAHATDWTDATQGAEYPITFTVDRQAPTVTIDAATLTNADTWAPGSGVLRFHGTAGDSIGLATVQIREGNNPFVDATFGNGLWQTALPVTDPEGRTLTITVRAIDRAGRISQATQTIGTDLSSPDAPDTTITASPANPSNVNTAGFEFSGSESAVAFACQLDANAFTPCASPWTISNLSKGEHTFRVRAIDDAGYVDLSPASFTWTVNASALDATITAGPANPSSSRNAGFSFTGSGSGFECSLDGAAFTTCTSGVSYTALSYGEHSFVVRAVNGGQTGAAARYTWTILNTPPVAADQSLTTLEDEALAVTLSASDEDPLTYQVVAPPAHGVLVGVAPNLLYSPDSGFSGADSFTFRANDGQSESNLATVSINVEATDNTPPVTTIALDPATAQGQNGWYTAPVRVRVTVSDGDDPKAAGVAETRCLLDPAGAPATFADLPAECPYLGGGAEVTADGLHTLYAASRDNRNNEETPVSRSFQLDRTPPTVSVTGISGGVTYPLGAVPSPGCDTSDATSGVAATATVQVNGGNAHGVGSFSATCGPATDQAGNASTPVTAAYTVGYDLSRFVMLGQEGVALGLLSQVHSGDVGARAAGNGPLLADNAEVSIGQQAKLLDPNSRVLGNRLAVKLLATVYNPSYNTLTNNGQVLGTTATPLNTALLPTLPGLPTITPGTQNLSVAQFGTLTVNPGSYGTLTVNQYATVTFSGGVYHFQSWSVNQYAKLYFAAPTEIRVAGRVNVVQYSTLAPAPSAPTMRPSDIVLYVAGQNGNNGAINASPKTVVFGQGSTIQLNVVAPNGTIQVDQLAQVTGALLGRWVSVGQQVKLTLASAFAQTGSANAATADDPTGGGAEPPAEENPTLPPSEELPSDGEEEPLPSTWTHALFLPLVTATAEANASAEPIEAEVFEEPIPVSDSALPAAPPPDPAEPDGAPANRIFLPVVTQ